MAGRRENTVIASKAEDFRCPACRGTFDQGALLTCRDCARTYPVRDGILDFRVDNRSYYFNPVPPEEMRTLVRDMEDQGWAGTVSRFVRHVSRTDDWIDNLTADGRYAWKLLLDLQPGSTVLDIGCGLGNLSYNLAPHVGKVYAMDLTFERVAFARRRFEMVGDREHVVVLAGGDGTYLPFPDASLDCVVLSGVLEWVGDSGLEGFDQGSRLERAWRMARAGFGERSPRAIQLRFLREIRRVLRPEGQLFVAIENRTGYRYFLGDPDHHSGVRYTSLLPRALANLYSIWTARRPYRTYTYSAFGYRRLLRRAGFADTEFFGLLPGYSHMRTIVPLDGPRPGWRPTAPNTVRDRVATNRYLVPAYGIIAGARGRGRRLMDDVVSAVEASLASQFGPGSVCLHDFQVTGKDKGVVTAEYAGRPVVIKLPFGPGAGRGEAANARFLALAKAGFGQALAYVPHARGSGSVRGVAYFVEDRCPGEPLHRAMTRTGRTTALPRVEALLADLNPDPAREGDAFVGEFYDGRVTTPLGGLALLLADPCLVSDLDAFFRERLHGVRLPRGIEHGDFGHDNILTHDGRVTGLIDWEGARADGIPVLDVLSYLEAAQRLHGVRQSLRQTVPLLARGAWPVRDEWAFLERQYARFGIDPSRHTGLVSLYWLQHVSSLMAYGLGYDAARIEHDLVGTARALLELA